MRRGTVFKFLVDQKNLVGEKSQKQGVYFIYPNVTMTELSYKKAINRQFWVQGHTVVRWMKFICAGANWTFGHAQLHENPNENPEMFLPGLRMLLHSNTMR